MSSINSRKLGSLEVFEDDKHFLIRIHPENRDRAKKIVGRQWDGDRKVWVYPKNLKTYEALTNEFQKDADSFNIQRPAVAVPLETNSPVEELDNDGLENQPLDDFHSIKTLSEGQGKLHNDLEQIRVLIESLRDDSANQSRTLEELNEKQERTSEALMKLELPTQQEIRVEKVRALPVTLNLKRQKEVELLEKALVSIASFMVRAKDQKTFCAWMDKHHPLINSAAFVTETHEFLKRQIGQVLGDEDPRTPFRELIRKAKDERIYFEEDNYVKKSNPIDILYTLNTHRNRFGHPTDFNQSEKWSRAILYLMNLALIWSQVVLETEDTDN